jgi:creatinine amidohydrolase
MQWEKLNTKDFIEAVKTTGGVCVIPAGSIERHGDHMPLGTDYLVAHRVCALAAEREPAMVFPGFYLAQVCESMASRGTVALDPALIMQVVRNLFEEIVRNGFHKILLVNGHGGNEPMWNLMAFSDMRQPRDYMVYYTRWYQADDKLQKMISDDCQGRPSGHACEWETSMAMALLGEDSVNLANVPEQTMVPQTRKDGIAGQATTGLDWFCTAPECYLGNARHATAERGRRYAEFYIDRLAKLIRAIKDDQALPALQKEFYRRSHGAT